MWVWIAVFVVIALFQCSREGLSIADPPPAGYALKEGTMYNTSKAVGPTIFYTTPEKCTALCTETQECEGIIFSSFSKFCFMIKELGESSPNSAFNTYLKSGAPAVEVPLESLPAGWTLFASNTQHDGETERKTANASDCMAACSDMPGCQGIGSKASDCRLYTLFSNEKKEIAGYHTYKYAP